MGLDLVGFKNDCIVQLEREIHKIQSIPSISFDILWAGFWRVVKYATVRRERAKKKKDNFKKDVHCVILEVSFLLDACVSNSSFLFHTALAWLYDQERKKKWSAMCVCVCLNSAVCRISPHSLVWNARETGVQLGGWINSSRPRRVSTEG